MSTHPLLALRRRISALTSASDLQAVADALHAGSVGFEGAPSCIADLWTLDSKLYDWQITMEHAPLDQADTLAMLTDVDAAWQGVAALVAGGVVPT